MPAETKTARWKIILGYVAFSLAAFVLCLYLTFPYDALKERVQSEARASGLYVKLGSIGPGLFGIRAKKVELAKRATGDEDTPPESLRIDSVSIRPSLFPLGVAIRASALGGSMSGTIGGLKDLTVRLSLDELNLSGGNLKGFSGVDLAGNLSGEVALTVPRTSLGPKAAAEPDLGQANGTITLNLKGFQVNGGTLTLALPMMGPEPVPIGLPKLNLGDLEGALKFQKGQGTIEKFSLKGDGVELNATGTLKLAKRLQYSEPALELRLKTTPEFVKALGMYGAGLSMLPSDPKDPSWRLSRISGSLERPMFR